MKKIVVTGGAGFIGSHLAEELVARGYETHVVDNLSEGKREQVPEGSVFHEVDILKTQELVSILTGAEGVFHFAALPRVQFSIEHPLESHQANVDGTLSVLLAAKEAKVNRVIFASSSAVYGDQEELPFTEVMDACPNTPYAYQKYVAELYVQMFARMYGLPGISLRFFNVYGSRMDPDGGYALVIPKFLAMRSRGESLTITGDGEQTRDFTHVSDVVRACLLTLESQRIMQGEVINIGSGRNTSMNHIADLIGGERAYIPARVESRNTRADITKAKELLGWEPSITLEQGVAELKKEWKIS